ncbi:MAG TPA: response regulator transcription factor [Noviherbaspirillum sp.]|nr:response regulator transcription factor [Noviherbaspirillum sp.]
MRYSSDSSLGDTAPPRKLVIVIDDHPLVSASLRDLISLYSFSAEVRSFSSFSASVNVLQNEHPILVFLDLGLPDITGRAAIDAVRAKAPKALLAILSGNDELARDIPEIQNKTLPFLHKGLSHHMLTKALRGLLDQCGLDNGVQQHSSESEPMLERFDSLTPKQREILRLLATGRTNQDIAAAQNVSVETIKTHLHDIYAKLRVKNRTQAILLHQSAYRLVQNEQ